MSSSYKFQPEEPTAKSNSGLSIATSSPIDINTSNSGSGALATAEPHSLTESPPSTPLSATAPAGDEGEHRTRRRRGSMQYPFTADMPEDDDLLSSSPPTRNRTMSMYAVHVV